MPRAGPTKAERLAAEVAEAVHAGAAVGLETVDFADPDRPPTCLEVDFPILPVNQVAAIEGNAGKPIYQMSKWWAPAAVERVPGAADRRRGPRARTIRRTPPSGSGTPTTATTRNGARSRISRSPTCSWAAAPPSSRDPASA